MTKRALRRDYFNRLVWAVGAWALSCALFLLILYLTNLSHAGMVMTSLAVFFLVGLGVWSAFEYKYRQEVFIHKGQTVERERVKRHERKP